MLLYVAEVLLHVDEVWKQLWLSSLSFLSLIVTFVAFVTSATTIVIIVVILSFFLLPL